MGSSRLPDEIPIPAAIKFQNWVFGIGGISALICACAFAAGNGGAGVIFGGGAFALFWGGSKVKTHMKAFGEGKVYH